MVARPDTFADRRPGRRRAPLGRAPLVSLHPEMRQVIESATLEIVPMNSLERAVSELPAGSRVSVTCSPAKTIEATLDVTRALLNAGHHAVPHVAGRMIRDAAHLADVVDQLGAIGAHEIFVVAGDIDPPGTFFDAIEFLDAFLSSDPDVRHIGFTAYPDTHPAITPGRLHEALHRKQQMILSSGRTAHVSTQMCFSSDRIRSWIRRERAAGLGVPVHLGVAGVIDRTKLMTTGMRLGVGSSLRYLSKNRSAIGRLMTQRSYQPDQLLRPLAADLDTLGIESLHLFTFNQVRATQVWRASTLAR